MGNFKLNGFPDVAAQMVELETDNSVRDDQTIFADLAIVSNVESKGAESVVTIGHADERAECFRPLVARDEFEIKGRAVMAEIYVAITSSEWCVNGASLPFNSLGFGEDRAATFVSHAERLAVTHQTVATAYDAEHAPVGTIDDRFLVRDGQPSLAAFFLDAYEYRMFFHGKKYVIKFGDARHGLFFLAFGFTTHAVFNVVVQNEI